MTVSFEEELFHQYFRWLLPDEEIIQCDHEQLAGKELDLWFPKLRAAVEVGSWFCHQQSEKRDKQKRRLAKKRGIRLVSVLTSKTTGLPKVGGRDVAVVNCPNSPEIIWTSYRIGWSQKPANRVRLKTFMEVIKPVCELLSFDFKEPSQTEYEGMMQRAVELSDTTGLNTSTAVEEQAPVETAVPAKTEKPLVDRITRSQLVQSMKTDWQLIHKVVADLSLHDRQERCEKLVEQLMSQTLGITGWPEPVKQRITALCRDEYRNRIVRSGSNQLRITSTVYAMACSYEVGRQQTLTVGKAMALVSDEYRLEA